MKSASYKDLEVWKKSINLAKMVYDVTSHFPANEKYGLAGQIQRSAVSVSANIAEGQARNSPKEFNRFLGICLGSLAELETLLIIAHEISYIPKTTLEEITGFGIEITKMIKGIIKHLSKSF